MKTKSSRKLQGPTLAGFTLAAAGLAAASLVPAAKADVILLQQGGLTLNGAFTGAFATVNSINPGFGAGNLDRAGRRRAGPLHGLEGFIEPGLGATYDAGHVSLYGGVSAIAAATRGSGDAVFPTDSTSGHPNALRLENLYAGVKSGDLVPGLPKDAIDLSFGRQTFQIGDGFLIADGNADGGRKAAYWLAPRTAFARTAIARIETGTPLRADLFRLGNDASQTDDLGVAQPARTSLYGVNLEWNETLKAKDGTSQKLWTLGGAFLHLYDADIAIAPARDGMDVYDLRASGGFIPSLPDLQLAGELVHEHNGDARHRLDANAWYVQPGWKFPSLPWTPQLSYRYAHFSGSAGSGTSHSYDPLFYGSAAGYGSWYMGEIIGQYVLFNSNDDVNMLRLAFQPTDKVDFGLIGYHFDFAALPAGVTSHHAFNEADLYADYAPLSWLTFTGVLGAAKSARGGKQFIAAQSGAGEPTGRTWYLAELGATIKF